MQPIGIDLRDAAASPPFAKGDLGGFKKASNPPCPPFSKGGNHNPP
jgi:hypothetical protein